MIGAASVAQAASDDHTLLLTSIGIVANRITLHDVPCDPKVTCPP